MWCCHTRLLQLFALLPQPLEFTTITSLFCFSWLCCRICKLLSCLCQSALCQACTICSATSVFNLSSILIQFTSLCSTCCSVTDFFIATDCSDVPQLILMSHPPFKHATGFLFSAVLLSTCCTSWFSTILPTEPLATTAKGPLYSWTSAHSCSALFFLSG